MINSLFINKNKNYIFLQLQKIKKLINDSRVRDVDATRLVMLYALHYAKHTNNDIAGLCSLLKKREVSEKYVKVICNI